MMKLIYGKYLRIGSVCLVVLGIASFATTQETSEGNLISLFPAQVGVYQRVDFKQPRSGEPFGIPFGLLPHRKTLGMTAGAKTVYFASSENKRLIVEVIRFSTAANANEAVKLLKQNLEPNELRETGEKTKAGRVVGERLAIDVTNRRGRVTSTLFWTNDALMFWVRSYYPDRGESYVPSNASDAKEFENNFPY